MCLLGSYAESDGNDVLSLGTFLARCYRKLNFLTILKGLETIALDRTEVDEYVGAAFLLDKSVTLGFVKPLYGACNL